MKQGVLGVALAALLCSAALRAQTAETQGAQPAGDQQAIDGQGGPPPPPGPRHAPPTSAMELKHLTRELTLTDAQQTAIRPILERRQTEEQALRGSGLDREAEHTKRKALADATRADIRAQLTEAQQKQFDAMPRPGGPHGPEGPPPPPPAGEGPATQQ